MLGRLGWPDRLELCSVASDIFSAVGVLSVPFSPLPIPPLDAMKAFARAILLWLYFQTPGVAKVEKDVRTGLRKFYHLASGEMDFNILGEKSGMTTC